MDSVVIGTAPDCELRVTDPLASARHCRVVRHEDGTLWVVDLGSLNGTWLAAQFLTGLGGVFGTAITFHDDLRVRGTPEPWRAGQTLWVGRSGLELDRRGWVRAVSR